MIYSLISGTMFRSPEERTAKSSGKFYVSATLKTTMGTETAFCRVLFFNEADHAEILSARDGDAIAVVGTMSVEVYDKGDGAKPSLSIVASRLLMLKREKKAAKPKAKKESHPSRTDEPAADYFGDSVPF